MRPVPQICLDFLRGAEGCRLTAYADSGNRITVGYGHTDPSLSFGLTITQAQADAYLFADATQAATRIALCVRADRIAALSEHQYAALISFAFNLGFNPAWQIVALLNAGNLAAVPDQMSRFDKARINGQLVEVPGLMHRRAAERALWSTADVGSAITIAQAAPEAPPPSSETRAAETPATPDPTRPLNRQKSFVSSVLGTMAAGGMVWADQLKSGVKWLGEQMPGDAGQSTILSHLQSELPLALFALTLASAGFLALRQHLAKTS